MRWSAFLAMVWGRIMKSIQNIRVFLTLIIALFLCGCYGVRLSDVSYGVEYGVYTTMYRQRYSQGYGQPYGPAIVYVPFFLGATDYGYYFQQPGYYSGEAIFVPRDSVSITIGVGGSVFYSGRCITIAGSGIRPSKNGRHGGNHVDVLIHELHCRR